MSSRRTFPFAISGQNTSPASTVFPKPTSSATSQRVGHASKIRRHTHSWCGSNAIREVERTPHMSFTDSMAAAWARVTHFDRGMPLCCENLLKRGSYCLEFVLVALLQTVVEANDCGLSFIETNLAGAEADMSNEVTDIEGLPCKAHASSSSSGGS